MLCRSSRRLTIEQVRALTTVASTHALPAAAEKLGAASATSVYHLVERLGDLLGRGPLFTGSVRGHVTLTAAGDEVMSQAEKLVTSCDALLLDRS